MDLFSRIAEHSWVRERYLLGVEAVALEGGKWEFRAVKAERKGGGLDVLDRDQGGNSAQELKERFGEGLPLVLVISGKGVVHKPIAEDKGAVKDRMDQVLPNADPEAFYFQEYKSEQGGHWGSLVRRDQLDGLLRVLGEEGFYVTALTIGPFTVLSYWELFFGEKEEARFGPFELQRPSGPSIGLERRKEEERCEVEVGGERFDHSYILALSGLFEELLDKGELLPPDIPVVKEGRREQDHKNLFRKGSMAATFFFLLLLLGNYLAYESASSRLGGLKEELRMKEGLLERLEELEQEYRSKERILEAASVGTRDRFSFFADRIAGRVPEGVRLTRMELAPLTEKVEEGERIRTDEGKVLIEGTTMESSSLNRMVRQFKELGPIAEVSVLDYHQRQREEGAEFKIEVQLQ